MLLNNRNLTSKADCRAGQTLDYLSTQTPGWPIQRIRDVDRIALENFGMPGVVLMENAGRGAADWILQSMNSDVNDLPKSALVLCGTGNNGGDGFVIARHLHAAHVPVTVCIFGSKERMAPDAWTNFNILSKTRIPCRWADVNPVDGDGDLEWMQREMSQSGWILDALLGTGAAGAPRGRMATAIELANQSRAKRVAIDLPSGLDGETGEAHIPTFLADATLTFVATKIGFDSPNAKKYLGQIVVLPIGVPPEVLAMAAATATNPRRKPERKTSW